MVCLLKVHVSSSTKQHLFQTPDPTGAVKTPDLSGIFQGHSGEGIRCVSGLLPFAIGNGILARRQAFDDDAGRARQRGRIRHGTVNELANLPALRRRFRLSGFQIQLLFGNPQSLPQTVAQLSPESGSGLRDVASGSEDGEKRVEET